MSNREDQHTFKKGYYSILSETGDCYIVTADHMVEHYIGIMEKNPDLAEPCKKLIARLQGREDYVKIYTQIDPNVGVARHVMILSPDEIGDGLRQKAVDHWGKDVMLEGALKSPLQVDEETLQGYFPEPEEESTPDES